MGRPSTCSEDVAAEICERLSKGEPLAQICRDDGMPCPNTVRTWAREREPLAEAIARAREDGFDVIASECLEIADDATNDWMEKHDSEGNNIGWQLNGEHVQRSKLRVETRLKLLAKWDPKRYGDRLDLGNADGQPFQIVNKRFGRGGENG